MWRLRYLFCDCDGFTPIFFDLVAPMAIAVFFLWIMGIQLFYGMFFASMAFACFWSAMANWGK
jgi:hypothetical protein